MFTNDANGPYCWNCSLNVEWHDCSFCPAIQLRRGIMRRNGNHTTVLPAPSVLPHPGRRKNLFKPMKNNVTNARRTRNGFTLVELLTVIAIIGILAAMLLPVLAAAKKHALIMKARTEISALVTGIESYDQAYGRFPVGQDEQNAASLQASRYGKFPNIDPDFTYGGTFVDQSGTARQVGTLVNGTAMSNSNLVAILMDYTNFPTTGLPTVNNGYVKNPQQRQFLQAKPSGWDPTQTGTPVGGIDNNLTYRDPWGNPYLISIDLNYDDQTMDDVYRYHQVSQNTASGGNTGFYGLAGSTQPGSLDAYQFHGKVMVWSAGPDGKIDKNTPANTGLNKDNILSWK